MLNVIEIDNLCFSYEEDPILRNLELQVEAGELLALVGENGAGKSTLMNLMLGNLTPTSGEIRLFGDAISKDNHYRDVAYVSQDAVRSYKFFPTTISELVSVHLRYLHRRDSVEEIIRMVGLEKHLDKRLDQLSGGQLQRVGLLLALVKDASLILLDEPTTGIDKEFSHELYHILQELQTHGRTIVVITHQLAEASPFVDRVVRLRAGSLVEVPQHEWHREEHIHDACL
ncbi:ATP-binding cassette domain-containing protein [Collinsella sp. zg1085]|uniref:metal ABC transporter ATP-binding protein n=1 Tax=Collinsella sp. zg1085 TaxID=2844380 RepID=UPI001C0DD38E|nr:ATP-binding cassette domain-containing protein [Collinsella sp. zg1085]QWT17342.1 ATP-binding cassette domain-containing protein [Collinsella sp. zg1085]